ncbi:hypothetical protein PIB30_004019 [Stylosanthes scabra]|uniref:Uncharacterized protein n=1 Tax=Stylosanthes scabra TaxID=79078 RepID=A0ABU6X0Z9_9FABA|nr:hypothetical protein [Stylosanthes scabra]
MKGRPNPSRAKTQPPTHQGTHHRWFVDAADAVHRELPGACISLPRRRRPLPSSFLHWITDSCSTPTLPHPRRRSPPSPLALYAPPDHRYSPPELPQQQDNLKQNVSGRAWFVRKAKKLVL